MQAIEVSGLVREFRERLRAADGMHLEVAAGEVYGVLGPKGEVQRLRASTPGPSRASGSRSFSSACGISALVRTSPTRVRADWRRCSCCRARHPILIRRVVRIRSVQRTWYALLVVAWSQAWRSAFRSVLYVPASVNVPARI